MISFERDISFYSYVCNVIKSVLKAFKHFKTLFHDVLKYARQRIKRSILVSYKWHDLALFVTRRIT
jgi:hypothetical protein